MAETDTTTTAPRDQQPPVAHATEFADDAAGFEAGYAAAEGEATYTGDIAMMRAEADHTEQTVLAHYELLIAQAEQVGNGPQTVQALRAGLEAARAAAGSTRDAIAAVERANEAVQTAYDATAGEAATDKAYFHGG